MVVDTVTSATTGQVGNIILQYFEFVFFVDSLIGVCNQSYNVCYDLITIRE